jgi:hypothetical protein
MRPRVKILLVVFISLTATACGKSDIEKSKAFIAAGEFSQAIALLNEQILENSENAEAHFLLGRAYLNTEQLQTAEERFTNAITLKSDYARDIGWEYKKAGESALKRDNPGKAIRLFQAAVRYRPDLNKSVARSADEKGRNLATDGKNAEALGLHRYAIANDPLLGKKMGKWYAVKAEKADSVSEKAEFRQAAAQFTDAYQKEVKRLQLTAAKQEAEKSAQSMRARMKMVIMKRLDERAWQKLAAKGLKILGNEETLHWSVKYYENKGYDVERRILNDKEWMRLGTVANQSDMFFLSSKDFSYSKSSGAEPRNLSAAITKAKGIRFYGDADMDISIKTERPPAEIFYWIADQY